MAPVEATSWLEGEEAVAEAPASAESVVALADALEKWSELGPARAAALLRRTDTDRVEPLAAWSAPGDTRALGELRAHTESWLARGETLRTTAIVPLSRRDGLYPDSERFVIFVAAPSGDPGSPAVTLIAGFLVECESARATAAARRLHIGAALVHTVEATRSQRALAASFSRLERALRTIEDVVRHGRLQAALFELCNAVAARFEARRASCGLIRGALVAVEAMSHAERIDRRTPIVRRIEAAMDECVDQECPVLVPGENEPGCVSRAARALAESESPVADGWSVCSLPIMDRDGPLGALTVERSGSEPWSEADVAALRVVTDAVAGHLRTLRESDRWLSSLAFAWGQRQAAVVVGPTRVGTKLLCLGLAAALLAVCVIRVDDEAKGTCRFDSVDRRTVAAPFDGFLREARARAGDTVAAGDALATLDTTEDRLRLAAAKAQLASAQKEASIAQRDAREAESQMARAKADRAEAEVALYELRIHQAALTAPVGGVVTRGDHERDVGAPVRQGDALYEIASPDRLEADIFVPEHRAAELKAGQRVELAPASFPDRRVAGVVARVDPAASVIAGKNVFRAVVTIEESPAWVRPGMEGMGRITVARRALIAVWTRPLTDWIRMRLWL